MVEPLTFNQLVAGSILAPLKKRKDTTMVRCIRLLTGRDIISCGFDSLSFRGLLYSFLT